MKCWTVEGADSTTGADRVLSIEAPSRADAEREASAQGILVAEIHESSTSDALDDLTRAAEAAKMRGVQRPAPSSATINYQPPPPPAHRPSVPAYTGLSLGSTILFVFAMV